MERSKQYQFVTLLIRSAVTLALRLCHARIASRDASVHGLVGNAVEMKLRKEIGPVTRDAVLKSPMEGGLAYGYNALEEFLASQA